MKCKWFSKKKDEPAKPPTRAQITTRLFVKWGDQPFAHDGLVGVGKFVFRGDNFGIILRTGTVDIQEDNQAVVHIDDSNFFGGTRTTIYDAAYSDRLDGYIVALAEAIEARDDAIKAKRILELTQF